MLLLVPCVTLSYSAPPPTIQARLQQIANAASAKYSCNVSLAVQHPTLTVAVAAGGAVASDHFVWGSVTKQVTGSALLQAVDAGLLQLDHPVAAVLDPALSALGLGRVTELWGAGAADITARHLATMTSGVPDYDTAEPHGHDDPLRAQVYAAPAKELTPADLLKLPWVATGKLKFAPGTRKAYSSTNFVLIGLLLAQLHKAPAWDAYEQSSVLDSLPSQRQALYNLSFAVHGTPHSAAAVAGFDRTSYNGEDPTKLPGHPVADVAGVFGGWTASDLTGTASDVARFAYDLYGDAAPQLLSPGSKELMIPTVKFYGFAAFNLTGLGGNASGVMAPAYGHLGATYGFDSLVVYFPESDVALAVATDIETDSQAQPRDVVCGAYNEVLGELHGTPAPSCTYEQMSYYKGFCKCSSSPTPTLASPPSAAPPIPPPDPLCPAAQPQNQTFFFFHPPSNAGAPLAWADHDYGDVLGEALFYCTDGYSVVHYHDTHMSKLVVEVSPAFGGYQSCTDTEPGNCSIGAKLPNGISIGDNRHVGRRRAVFYGECGQYSPKGQIGQCSPNSATGNWYSFPAKGECTEGTAVGAGGCTWRVVQLVKTVAASCLEGLGINASCAAGKPVPEGDCSYSRTAEVIEKAFGDEAAGGCADVPL